MRQRTVVAGRREHAGASRRKGKLGRDSFVDSPDSATQDTTLDVTISGSGFASDAVARWALAGVPDSTQVRTNSTLYVNARTLVANITISAKAAVGKWDVMVMSKGKGGIGTETFAIKLNPQVDTNSRAFITWESQINVAAPGAPVNMQPAGIAGDGRDSRGQSAASSQYQGAFCGVQGSIFWRSGPGQSGDLVFDPDKEFSNTKTTCPKRTLNFYLSYQNGGARGTATPIGAFTNVRQVMQLAQGGSRLQGMRFWYIGFRNCDGLSFESRLGISGVSDVKVTRLQTFPMGPGSGVSKRSTRISGCAPYFPRALLRGEHSIFHSA